jgi:CDGSH-type Zn-finger protein
MENTKPLEAGGVRRIVVRKNGSYSVEGGVPAVQKKQVISEHGEPLTWRTDGAIPVPEGRYSLCRCGHSGNPPFCDMTHRKEGFDGTETADTDPTANRRAAFPGGTRIIVSKDPMLCMSSGFCGLRDVGIAQLVTRTQETQVRSLVMAMVERCPSGALTYRVEAGGPDIEPDLPQQIALTIEVTSEGPIAGPLWVSGGIPVERSDGQPFETRNRVTLCNCGQSANKPLCDGTHRDLPERAAWARRLAGK